MSICSFEDVPEAVKEKLDAKGKLVKEATKVFKQFYTNAVKPIYVSQIVNGEIIKTNEENIFINEDVMNDPKFEEQFTLMKKHCSKTLYEYQENAIRKLVQLERRGYNINRTTHDKIISNGWLLSLPIGSGKSIVFEFLSIFFRDVPCHPIIISTDGHNLNNIQQVNFEKYPLYYENCAYIEKDANAVVVMKGYERREVTVILTHAHLIQQMKMYFAQDFPRICNPAAPKVKIVYANSMFGIDVNKLDILVIEANAENVKHLVALSYEKPFLRVIIDDYTSMNDVESFREILASSTIFVSGSKFQRDAADIPPSYYTLKHVPVNQISIVGEPEDTLQGIFRDNIATFELMGNSCEFNMYNYVTTCETICKSTEFKSTPSKCYPIIATEPRIKNYLAFGFIINHMARVKKAILNVENALRTGKIKEPEVEYYLKWKKMMRDFENNPPKLETVNIGGKNVRKYAADSTNPLYNYIYASNSYPSNVDGNPVVEQKCYVCGAQHSKHLHYGMIATCCGAFICSNCLKNSATHVIANTETGESIVDKENYYCVCCRSTNPRYIFNVNHKRSSTNVHSYYLANEFYDVSALEGHNLFDYYFYMCLEGFKPMYQEGKAININKDIGLGVISADTFKKHAIPTMDRLLPVDQLSLHSLHVINKTLHDLNIIPKADSVILIYNCPIDIQERVRDFYKSIITTNDPKTMLKLDNTNITIKESSNKIKAIQPISRLTLEFKSRVSDLIGLHRNIVAILQWAKPEREDEVAQLIGRCLRLNNFGNKLYFYITTSSTEFE